MFLSFGFTGCQSFNAGYADHCRQNPNSEFCGNHNRSTTYRMPAPSTYTPRSYNGLPGVGGQRNVQNCYKASGIWYCP